MESVTNTIHDDSTSGTLPTCIADLQALDIWCVWKLETRKGKPTKVPYTPSTGRRAKSNDPTTFGSYADAEQALATGRYAGLGFLVLESLDLAFIDLDHVVDSAGDDLPGNVRQLITDADSYAEESPTGTGVHILMAGSLGNRENRNGGRAICHAEAYDKLRFATFTGKRIPGTPETFNDNHADLTAILDRLDFPSRTTAKRHSESAEQASRITLNDRELIGILRKEKGGKAARLLDGDASGYPSPSEARAALAYKCRFRGADAEQIARILRAHGPWADGESASERDRRSKHDAAKAVEDYTGPTHDPNYGKKSGAGPSFRDSPADAGSGPDDPEADLREDGGEATQLSRTLAEQHNRFYAKSGDDWPPITNFVAWIDAYVTEDDGSGAERTNLRIRGALETGEALPAIMVPADEFGKMHWITAYGGAGWHRAVVEPGTSTRDKARAAIQHFSKDRATVERRYMHTGWRNVDGDMMFLSGAGAVTSDGIRTDIDVQLDGGLERYGFQRLQDRDTLREHGRKWRRILDLAPDRIIAPAVATIPRAILGEILPIDFAGFLYGRTGVFKSELAALLAAHFGRGLSRLTLPLNWESTANSIEVGTYRLKDVVSTIDDFAPAGSSYQVASQHATLERTLRGIGNNSGRGRMHADGSLRQTFTPRGLPVITAEENPRGHSATARAQHIEIGSGDVNPAVLTDCQALAAAGVFEELTAGFISDLAKNWERTTSQVQAIHAGYLRDTRSMTFGHARTGDAVAGQLTAVNIWFGYLASIGAIGTDELPDDLQRMRAGILAAGMSQANAVADVDPVTLFLDLTRAAIASEAAHLADKGTNSEPNQASRFGWRIEMISTRDSVTPVGKPQGRRIGWVDLEADAAYLNLPAALAVVQDLGSKQGQSIAIAPKTLAKRIADRGLIVSSESGRQLQKIYVAGGSQRVLHLALSTVLPPGEPEESTDDPTVFAWEAAS